MSSIAVGTPAAQKLVPLYEVHTLTDRTVTRKVYSREDVLGKNDKRVGSRMTVREETVVLPTSYLVYFPGGHAVAFDTEQDMKDAGINKEEHTLVDRETGERITPAAPVSLRARSEAKGVAHTIRRA